MTKLLAPLLVLLVFSGAASFAAPAPSLLAPLTSGTESFGEVWAYPAAGDKLAVGVDTFLPALEKALEPEAFGALKKKLAGRTTVTLRELRTQGLSLRFDEAALALRLELKEEQRRRLSLAVRRSLQGGQRETVGPAAFSGYINGTASQNFLYPRSKSRQPFRGSLSGATNWQGFVLEGGETFSESDQNEWQRDDTRLVRDFESRLLRSTLGDLQLNTVGYQTSRPLGGISLSRQYSIQPYASTRPLNRTEINLLRPSLIEVYVNDAFVSRLNAPAGPVQLSDFPLFSGVNQVLLKITDDTGKVEWVNLSMLYDVQLLGQGIQQFAYQVGAPSRRVRSDRAYDTKNTAFSGYHRFGVSDLVTLGANLQGDHNIVMGGADFAWLTAPGLFSLEGAYSDRGRSFRGQAGRLRFKSVDYKKGHDRLLRGVAEAEYRSHHFSGLSEFFSVNEFSWRYDLSLSAPLSATASLGTGFTYEHNRLGRDHRRTLRADFGAQLGSQWRTSLTYSVARERAVEHRALLTLNWIAESGRYYGNLSYDYPSKTVRAEGTRNSSTVVDDYRATVGIQDAPERARADALLEYTHEKANLRLEHASTYSREVPGVRSTGHSSTLTAATAVAWAGSSVGWSRPIHDSFAIISARPSLDNFRVPVNPLGDSYEANINRAGPAVVPTLSAYNESPLVLDAAGLPPGYSLGREHFITRPTYRSGIRLEVGGDSSATVTGRLLLPGGEPLALATGTLARVSPDQAAAGTFFTNREGGFVLEGIAPGDYELRPDKDGFRPYRFRLEPGKLGLVRLVPHTLVKGAP